MLSNNSIVWFFIINQTYNGMIYKSNSRDYTQEMMSDKDFG